MQILLLVLLFVSLVASTTRFESTTVFTEIVLRCKHPKDPEAKVFLMESDWESNAWDDDDTFDFGTYTFGKVPEMKLYLRGSEFEFSGLDPYVYVVHSCTNKTNSVEAFSVKLMEGMYMSRAFDIVIDLDAQTSVINSRIRAP